MMKIINDTKMILVSGGKQTFFAHNHLKGPQPGDEAHHNARQLALEPFGPPYDDDPTVGQGTAYLAVTTIAGLTSNPIANHTVYNLLGGL